MLSHIRYHLVFIVRIILLGADDIFLTSKLYLYTYLFLNINIKKKKLFGQITKQ